MGAARRASKEHATASEAAYASLAAYCPDLAQWPQRWRFDTTDLVPGQQIVVALEPFLLHLTASGLSRKVLAKHRDNLWLLGGELIRRMQNDPSLRRGSADDLLDRFLEDEGGPLIHPRISETEQRSFDGTCRRFYAFRAKSSVGKRR